MSERAFKEILEESLQQSTIPEMGEIIKTLVIKVTDKDVILDIGSKSEAILNINDFSNPPKVGDQIEVLVEKSGPSYLKVSYKRAEEQKSYLKVKNALLDHSEVEGRISEIVNGGFKVLLEGYIPAFLPLSHIELKKVDNPEKYKNRLFRLNVIKFEEKGRNLNIIVSRKLILEDTKKKKIEDYYNNIKIGDEVQGTVVKINPNSVIVEIAEHISGLIRIGDLSWDRIEKPDQIVKKGQKIKLKVLKVEPKERNILLSLKDMQQDPWIEFANQHQIGDTISGEVSKIKNKIVYLKIQEGVEGFIRFEDLSYSRNIKTPEEIVALKSVINAKILEINPDKKKLLLGIKQTNIDPIESIEEKYPIGKKVKGKIISKKDFGFFIELELGIDALLYKNDIDWTQKKIDINSYKEGDEIEGIVLKVNKKDRKINIGIKQLFENPWKNFASEYPKNSIVKGKVKEIKENEAVIDFGNDIDGYLPKNHLEKKVENINEALTVGDEIEVLVLEVNPEKNILRVSIRERIRKEQNKEVEKYMNQEQTSEMTFGDILSKNFDNIKNKIENNKSKSQQKENKAKNKKTSKSNNADLQQKNKNEPS